MLKLVRVDHRLLHGQVIFSWTKQYNINHIIVADNKVPQDPMTVMALSIAKPSDCKLDIVKIANVPAIMEKAPNDTFMILIKGPEEALELTDFLPEIKTINFGGVAKKNDSKAYGKAVFLNPVELDATRQLLDRNIQITVQQVPSSAVETVDFYK
jgi:fructoselysine and glucoselysine-specific PTS system IIB component